MASTSCRRSPILSGPVASILALLWRRGEPTLLVFSHVPINCIRDGAVPGMHSWKRGGRSKVSQLSRRTSPRRLPRCNHHRGLRTRPLGAKEDKITRVAALYKQWQLADRVCVALGRPCVRCTRLYVWLAVGVKREDKKREMDPDGAQFRFCIIPCTDPLSPKLVVRWC
jgi:hypothetical protein